MNKYQLPVASWVESFTDWLTSTFAGLFSFLQTIGQSVMDNITALLTAVPPLVLIVLLTIAAFFISNKKIGLSLFTFIGLMFIYNQNLWNDLMSTVTLVLLSSVISIIIGVPLGILMAKSEKYHYTDFGLHANNAWFRLLDSSRCILRNWYGSWGLRLCYLRFTTNRSLYELRNSTSAK